jgi:hypothetical protein
LKEEGRRKKEEGRRKREEGRGKKEEGRRKREEGDFRFEIVRSGDWDMRTLGELPIVNCQLKRVLSLKF